MHKIITIVEIEFYILKYFLPKFYFNKDWVLQNLVAGGCAGVGEGWRE